MPAPRPLGKSASVDPFVLYFRSLKTPKNLPRPSMNAVAEGREIFLVRCQFCHNAADGETLQAHAAEDLNTPLLLVDPLENDAAEKLAAAISQP